MEGQKREWYNLYLDMSSPVMRIIRRALVIGILTAISVALAGYTEVAPEYLVPVTTGLLALVDKSLREHKK